MKGGHWKKGTPDPTGERKKETTDPTGERKFVDFQVMTGKTGEGTCMMTDVIEGDHGEKKTDREIQTHLKSRRNFRMKKKW